MRLWKVLLSSILLSLSLILAFLIPSTANAIAASSTDYFAKKAQLHSVNYAPSSFSQNSQNLKANHVLATKGYEMSGLSAVAQQPISIKIYKVSAKGRGPYIGIIIAKDTRRGLLLIPRLHDLPPGNHGFHVHENPSCQNFAKAAGSHWDPKKTGYHRGPYRSGGHQGDLPVLFVNDSGLANRSVLAPRLTVADLKNHAFVIHAQGDNYTDHPPNGGGGARIACGVIQ